jgi:hypothetical protein
VFIEQRSRSEMKVFSTFFCVLVKIIFVDAQFGFGGFPQIPGTGFNGQVPNTQLSGGRINAQVPGVGGINLQLPGISSLLGGLGINVLQLNLEETNVLNDFSVRFLKQNIYK